MNTVEGTVARVGETLVVELPGGRVPLPRAVAHAVEVAAVSNVVVGARPEDLRIASTAEGVGAVVAAVESLGHERHVACRLADGQFVIVRQAVQEPAPAPDDRVRLVADPDAIHLFDPGTGARIE